MKSEEIQRMVEHVGSGLEPNADWMPALIVEKQGKLAIFGLATPMEDDQGKDAVAGCISASIYATEPDAACFVSTAWSLKQEDAGSYIPGTKISDHPNRIEVVMCFIME